MEADPSALPERADPDAPLTERILERLGPPRWAWIVLWSLIPLISPLVFGAAIRASGRAFGTDDFIALLMSQSGLAYGCFVLLVGTGLLARQATSARDELARLAPGDWPTDLFRRMGSVRGPLLLTATVLAITSANGWAAYGPLPPLAAGPLLFAYLLPILTFVWVDVAILADLDRIGRRPLSLDVFPQDRTLGLGRLGSLASAGLGLLLIAAVPVLLAGAGDPVTLWIGLAIIALSVAIFLLSMWRLHRQMATAKARYVEMTRRLYAEAYAPIRERPDAASLEARSSVLSVAHALEERAANLPTWPIDEGTLKFIAVVITGVVTSVVVRGLFAAIGF